MDPNWLKSELPKDCYQCILCHAVIPVKNKKKDKFEKHLRSDHGIFYNRNLILVICFLGRIQFFKLIDSIKSEKQTRDSEAQTEKPFSSDATMQTDDVTIETCQDNEDDPDEDTENDHDGDTDDEEDDPVTTQTLMDQIDKLTSVLKLNGQQDAQTLDELTFRDHHSTSSLETFEDTYDDSASEISDVCDQSLVSNDEHDEAESEDTEPMDELMDKVQSQTDNMALTYNDTASVASNNEVQLEEAVRQQEEVSKSNENQMDQNEAIESPNKRRKVNHDNTSEMIIDFVTKQSDYFKEKPKEIANSTEARALKFTETDPSLPEGWRVRAFVRKRGRMDFEYLSPELKVFRSKVGVVEYMKAMGGYSDTEMDRVCPGIRIKKEKI